MKIIKRLKGYRVTCPKCNALIEVNKDELEVDTVESSWYYIGKYDRHIKSFTCPDCGERVHLSYDYVQDIEFVYEDVK